jgi:hypothetical protein
MLKLAIRAGLKIVDMFGENAKWTRITALDPSQM